MQEEQTIGIIVAMPEERRAILERAKQVKKRIVDSVPLYDGVLGGKKVCIAEGGMGVASASRAATVLIEGYKPSILISAGYCGAVRAGARVADLIVCDQLFSFNDEGLMEVPNDRADLMSERLLARLQAEGLMAFSGTFITADKIISKMELDHKLPAELKTPVLEMESSAVAVAAAAAGIPFTGIRSVSDDAGEELDFALSELCDDQLRISVIRVIKACIRKPRIIPQLARLASNSAKAGKTLGMGVELIIQL